MKILMLHNYYQQPGGEDVAAEADVELLRSRGHDVRFLTEHNREVGRIGTTSTALRTLWSRQSYAQVKRCLEEEPCDVLHVHNSFPLISPSVYYAARATGVAVVQTVHNYRLMCPNGLFFHDGQPCEACVGSLFPGHAVARRCYRGSATGSAVVGAMLAVHRLAGTYTGKVDVYIALSRFSRSRLVAGGIPEDKIFLKPNFLLDDPQPGAGARETILFAGRLSPEKGITTLLEAWPLVPEGHRLKIAGDGPCIENARAVAARTPGLEIMGRRPFPEVLAMLRGALCLVAPSTCYESMPRSIIEAFACATPVIASDLGGMTEMIEHGKTGLLVPAGNVQTLVTALRRAVDNPGKMAVMGNNARKVFEDRYTADTNHDLLMAAYEKAIKARQTDARK